MSRYRMSWPIMDARATFGDLLGQAVHDLTRTLGTMGMLMAAPPDFSMPFVRGRRHLVAEVDVRRSA